MSINPMDPIEASRLLTLAANTPGGVFPPNAPARPESILTDNWSRDLVKAIAEDIGRDTVAYIEVMYPDAIKATSSTFKLSVRNHIYNQIMDAIEVNDAGQVMARLHDRANFRKWWVGVYRKLRRNNKRVER